MVSTSKAFWPAAGLGGSGEHSTGLLSHCIFHAGLQYCTEAKPTSTLLFSRTPVLQRYRTELISISLWKKKNWHQEETFKNTSVASAVFLTQYIIQQWSQFREVAAFEMDGSSPWKLCPISHGICSRLGVLSLWVLLAGACFLSMLCTLQLSGVWSTSTVITQDECTEPEQFWHKQASPVWGQPPGRGVQRHHSNVPSADTRVISTGSVWANLSLRLLALISPQPYHKSARWSLLLGSKHRASAAATVTPASPSPPVIPAQLPIYIE